MIRKISGKNKSTPLKHLIKNNAKSTSKKEIANTLASNFSKNSSSNNYSRKFQNIKQNAEKKKLNFQSHNTEEYNQPFSLSELIDSLKRSNNTSVGPDEIHYEFLKQLPDISLLFLLDIYNDIWSSGNVPHLWKQSTVIPIPKPGKDSTDPTNYDS